MSETIRRQAKAVVAGLGALGTALADSSVTGQEWTVVAAAALTAYGAVYRVPNRGSGREAGR